MRRVWDFARRPAGAALLIALIGGAALRLWGLTRQGFWTDELYVIWEARRPLGALLDPRLHIQHPPGYRFLLHVWLGAGLAEGWIRLLPALVGVALIGAIWAVARGLWPAHPAVAGGAALLVATSPFLLHYSQDVTAYSWTALAVTASVALLLRAWRADRPQWWAAWSLSLAVALYSHYFAVFPVAVEAAAVLAAGRAGGAAARGRLGRGALALAGAAALYVPWVATLLTRGGDALGQVWFPLSVDRQPLDWLAPLLAGGANPAFWQSALGLALAAGAPAAAGAVALGAWRRGALHNAWGAALVAGWAGAAILGPYGFLRLTTPPDAVDPVRFAALAAPALLLGLAGAGALLPAPARGALLAGWLLLAGVQWRAEISAPPMQDWRGALAVIAAQGQAGDAWLAFPAFHAGAAAAYYATPVAPRGGWFTGAGADPTGAAYWFPPAWQWRGFLDPVAQRSADWAGQIAARTVGATRLWYLAGDGADGTYPPSPAAERALAAAGWQPAGEWRRSPLVLRLYTQAAR